MRLLNQLFQIMIVIGLIIFLMAVYGASRASSRGSAPVTHGGFATAYCTGTITASGTPVGLRVAASVSLRPGTHIRLVGRAFLNNRRKFIVEDTGHLASNQLDLYTNDCAAARRWGVRNITYKIGWSKR